MDRTIPAQASTVRPPLQRPTGEAFTAVAALHLLGLVLLATDLGGPGWGILLSGSVFAYGRGVMHAFDFDHISVIDNSTRKFVTEGRPSRAVGFAFSLGHS